jgi:chemotaxis protein methyltransferase CheR
VQELEELEIGLLLEAIYRRYGYDFRNYALASMRRRVRQALRDEQARTVSALLEKVLHDPACMERVLFTFSVRVTSMFRDPAFYLAVRGNVVPLLRTYPFVRIWDAGCSTGEEVYSLAILLEEEGIYNRCRLYATDMNTALLSRAEAGIFPLTTVAEYATNYLNAGGRRAFADYYTAGRESVIFHPALRQNIVFAQHNLVTDGGFNDFHMVLCRNVMIYFNRELQDRVHRLLYDSLVMFGFLGLGSKETVQFAPYEVCYEELGGRHRLYRKVR